MFKKLEIPGSKESISYYVIVDRVFGEATFGIVVDVESLAGVPHSCGYLNVDKDSFYTHTPEEYVHEWDITFENISSGIVSLPPRIKSMVEIDEKNYWIGIDSSGMGLRIHDAYAAKLRDMFVEYNRLVHESTPRTFV